LGFGRSGSFPLPARIGYPAARPVSNSGTPPRGLRRAAQLATMAGCALGQCPQRRFRHPFKSIEEIRHGL
jgi:hypothetical protein